MVRGFVLLYVLGIYLLFPIRWLWAVSYHPRSTVAPATQSLFGRRMVALAYNLHAEAPTYYTFNQQLFLGLLGCWIAVSFAVRKLNSLVARCFEVNRSITTSATERPNSKSTQYKHSEAG